jgi:hypothetical protein
MMSFVEWLEKWARTHRDDRDTWGAMAWYIDEMIKKWHVCPRMGYMDIGRMLEFSQGTATRWMYNALYMQWQDEQARKGGKLDDES